MQAITTDNTNVTKSQLQEWLNSCDIPDDAELTLSYENGQFSLWWRWSFLAGAFGDDMVIFSKADSDSVIKNIPMKEHGE